MTPFDKARQIKAAVDHCRHMSWTLDPSQELGEAVADALLAYEPAPDAREAAREVVVDWMMQFPGELSITFIQSEALQALIASAIARATAATRAETIEECAKVAEITAQVDPLHPFGCEIAGTSAKIASAIRALGGAR